MTQANVRIALANVRYPATPEQSVEIAEEAIARASEQGAAVVCFPECYVPGYRGLGKAPPPPDSAFLERAATRVAAAAAKARVAVVLGTERLEGNALLATALIVGKDGTRLGFQDKVQVDPSEDGIYTPGTSRRSSSTRISSWADRAATRRKPSRTVRTRSTRRRSSAALRRTRASSRP